jgi:predicted naringenin-chalcone synthase
MKARPAESAVYLHAVSTAVPENSYTQVFARDFLLELQGKSPKRRELLSKVYANTGIDKRHTVIDDYGKAPDAFTFYPKSADLKPEPSTERRNNLFVEASNRLSREAAENLLETLDRLDRGQITHLITVSCTGFSVPGFDIHLVKSLGLDKSIDRFHIGFMGCCAAFPAMKLARDICLAHEDARVLIVAVELCTLHFQQKFTPEIVVANAIFADGAAAALVSAHSEDARGEPLRMEAFSSYLIDDSEKDMAWRIGKHGFDMRLSLYVPKLIETNIETVLHRLLDQCGVAVDEIDLFAIHPGGRAILDKVSDALRLDPGALDISYDVLREFGNMSSATIFFVLKQILERDRTGRIFSAAFGPGLTVETGLMSKGPPL